MVNQILVISTDNTIPYQNLALEESLLHHVEQGQCILYLWQNRKTVVIGKNQNAWRECHIESLERDGGFLVRRISGGGAVFHDLGNLNFTFVTKKMDYNVEKQTQVILAAVKKLGIQAEKTGRNDITVEGRKFSGNAYYQAGENCFHHGTILLHVDKDQMSEYLNVSKEKLRSKSVESVRSRTGNLSEFLPGITVEAMKHSLIEAFGECYGLEPEWMEQKQIDWKEVEELEKRFSSWDWKYGRKILFDYSFGGHFSWGELQVQIEVNEGRVGQINLFTDSLDTELADRLAECLKGVPYRAESLKCAAALLNTDGGLLEIMKQDIMQLICNSI